MYADKINNKKKEDNQYISKSKRNDTQCFQNANLNYELQSKYNNFESDNPKILNIRCSFDEVLSSVDGKEGRVRFYPDYLLKEDADNLYDYLSQNLKWQQREGMNRTGEKYPEPRMTCWFGKPYKYSAVTWDENQTWDKEIDELRIRLSKDHAIDGEKEYNSVMCNYYRDNKDSIGWHADDETSLGRYPKIASISLGAERVFEVCKRNEYYSRNYHNGPRNPVFNGCSILYRFHLNPGSLLIMEGAIQEDWLHRVPKESCKMDGRINLTYRYIVSEAEEKSEINRRRKRRRISDDQTNEDRNQSPINNKTKRIYNEDKTTSSEGKIDPVSKDKSGRRNKRNKTKPRADDVKANDIDDSQNKTEQPSQKDKSGRKSKGKKSNL